METTLPPIVAPFLSAVDDKVSSFFTTNAAQIASALHAPFRVFVTLYIVLWGLATWRGLVVEPLGDAISRLFRIVLVGSFALSTGVYAPHIASAAYATGPELASVLASSSTSPSAEILDQALNKGNQIALNYMDRVTSLSIGASIAAVFSAFFVWIFTAAIVLYGAAIVLVSKVALGVVLAFGPLFIACLLFESTKRLFESWMHQVINFMLLYALVVATISVMFALLDSQLIRAIAESNVSATADFSAMLALIVVGGACLVVLHHIPGLSSALSGGVHVTTLGALRWTADRASGPRSLPRRISRAIYVNGSTRARAASALLLNRIGGRK
jgi:type IV secretion system protein VirB6